MATVNKDFKIKNGLIVEGSNATVNGNQILTETASDQYIIDLIGGETLVTSVNSTQLEVVNGELSVKSGVFEAAGSIDALTTDDIEEGTSNKYFTNNRVIDVLTGSTQTNISITNVGGALHIEAENGVADSTTDDLTEGTTNKYYTDSRARLALSEGNGINYDNSTGTISADLGDFDTDDLTEGTNLYFTEGRARSAINAGTGIDYNSATGYIDANLGTGLGLDGSSQIEIDRTTVDTWYDDNGAASTVQGNLDTHTNSTYAHGTIGDIVGITDFQTLANKTISGSLAFGTDGSSVEDSAGNLTVYASDSLNLTSNGGDIILDADGAVYVGSSTAGNEVATHSYVDNAVSGLAWKQAVNLKVTSNINVAGNQVGAVFDGHDPLTTADVGYRFLVTDQNTASENGIWESFQDGAALYFRRPADADAYSELIGAAVYIMEGTQYGSTSWVQGNHYLTDFSGQDWTQFSGQGSVTAGYGIDVNGLEVSVDTGVIATQSDLSTGLGGKQDTLTAGSNISIDGSNTISVTGLASTDISDFNTAALSATSAAYDAAGAASTAETNANNYTDTELGSYTPTASLESTIDGYGFAYSSEIPGSTDSLTEGTSNLYYTDNRVKSVLAASTQTNISITEVAGELIITAENGVDDSTTDDLEEGANNHYFTESRAKIAAADLLVNHSTKNNITITGDENGLTITAENGVADSDTDDLDEGTTNLYFTDARAQDAVDGTTRSFTAININNYRKEEATQQTVASASTVTAHTFAYPYGSAKYLVRVVGSTGGTMHTQVTELLATIDGNNNVAVTEYGTIHTSENALATATVDYASGEFRLRVTTLIAGAEVIAAATLLSWVD